MVSYKNDFLYMSDGSGCPTEIVNGARLANNLLNSGLCGSRFSGIATNGGCDGLLYAPGVPSALADAVFWIDAADGQPTDQYARNRGTAGSILNAIYGANTTVGTDEPLLLNGADRYLYTSAVSGNNATAPNTAVLRCSTDFEIIFRVAADDWTPAATQALVSKFTVANQGYEVFLNTAGTLALIMRIAAADVTATSTVAPTISDGQAMWLRVTRVSSTGIVSFYTAPDQDNVPTAWTLLGATVASTTGAVTTGSTSFVVGERPDNTRSAAAKFWRVIIRNAVDAVNPVNGADFDFSANTSQSSFVATGGTVTINRSATGRKSVAYMGRPLWLFGTDDYMTVADNDNLDMVAASSFTVMAVLRPHNVAVGSAQVIVSKQNTLDGSAGWRLANGTAATTTFAIYDTGAVTTTGANKTASALAVVAGVRSVTADTLQAYLGGAASNATTDTTTATLANAIALRIGSTGGGASFLDAEVLAVMIWRRALTATEVSQVSAFYASSLGPASGSNYVNVDLTSTANPWYNASSAASQEAYGLLIEEWTGLDGAHHKRSSYQTGQRQGGAYFGPGTADMRTMKMNVLLHGSTERGLNYLFRWLEQQLLNCCTSNCGTRQLWLRQFCPTNPASDPTEGVLRAERIVLLEGLQWEAPPVQDSACFLRRASFTLAAGDPCLYDETIIASPPMRSTIAGVTITPTATASVMASCATWAGTNRRAQADIPTPEYGQAAPVVTITSPMSVYLTAGVPTRATLPVMRITCYSDPNGTGDPCRAFKMGELIIEGVQMAGLTLRIDMAQRRVTFDDPTAGLFNRDGSGFIGVNVAPGLSRWPAFDPCTSGFVVVEPAYATLDTVQSVGVTSGLRLVSEWTTTIGSAARVSCC